MLKCGKNKFNLISKTVSIIVLSGSILLLPAISYAQGGGDFGCGGEDPFNNNPCPIDSWVWVLVAAAAIFGTVYMHRNKKIQKTGIKF